MRQEVLEPHEAAERLTVHYLTLHYLTQCGKTHGSCARTANMQLQATPSFFLVCTNQSWPPECLLQRTSLGAVLAAASIWNISVCAFSSAFAFDSAFTVMWTGATKQPWKHKTTTQAIHSRLCGMTAAWLGAVQQVCTL
jgi:hypothetical protein